MRTLILLALLAACRPERVENPHSHVPTTNPEVQKDVGGTAPDSSTVKARDGSNVDLTQQFSDLITTQRSFQAGSRLITVSDSVLEDVVNLKRS